MKASLRRQRGVALLLVMAVLAMGGTWYMVSRLNRLTLNHSAADRAYNAEVLSRAKQALIGYVVAQANKAGENNPGALPCPEAPGSFNDTSGNDGKTNSAGCSLPAVGRYPWRTLGTDKFVDAAGEPLWYVISPGWAVTGVGVNTTINSNSVGQLNMDGVSSATQAAGDTVIALLIAPGLAMYTNCNGTGVSQARSPTSGVAPDWKNYLECENATSPADSNFVTTGPSASFNDQVLKVTVADLMPGLEAAIADRMQREIDPALKTIYGWSSALAGAAWGHTTLSADINSSTTSVTVASASGLPGPNFRMLVDTELMLVTAVSGTTLTVTRGYESSAATTHYSGTAAIYGGASAVYPYAASFSNPSTNAMQGSPGTYAGLLPLNYAETSPGSGTLCTASSSAPRCSPNFVAWHATGTTVSSASGTATLGAWTCTTSVGGSQFSCSIPYSRFCSGSFNQTCSASLSVNIAATVDNLGMALREVVTDLTTRISATTLSSPGMQVTLGNGGTGAVTLTGALPTTSCQTTNFSFFFGWYCNTSNTVTVTAPITVFADHPLTGTSDGNYGWFTRNKWHEVTYYAIASGYSPATLPSQPACTTGGNCLSVSNVTPTGAQRGILILAGRSINGSSRPSSTLGDYLEFGNATASYERQTVSRANAPALKKPFNDRVIAVDSN